MKVIIAGSRSISNYNLIKKTLDNLDFSISEVVSGTANGVDKLGERYASENNISIKRFPADWNKFGKSAGYIRNKEMVEYGECCIIFWDSISKGTKHMIDLAKKYNLLLKIFIIRRK